MRFRGVAFLIPALLLLPALLSAKTDTRHWQPAHILPDGRRTGPLLEAIRAGTEDRIGFNRHYSIAHVPCGVGCGSYFLVDRRSGIVIAMPESEIPTEMIWDISAKPDSDSLTILHGPRDGVGMGCLARRFRMKGHRFVALDQGTGVPCPN